jgi:hypothetical protein
LNIEYLAGAEHGISSRSRTLNIQQELKMEYLAGLG